MAVQIVVRSHIVARPPCKCNENRLDLLELLVMGLGCVEWTARTLFDPLFQTTFDLVVPPAVLVR
jgi:hypothetical protein